MTFPFLFGYISSILTCSILGFWPYTIIFFWVALTQSIACGFPKPRTLAMKSNIYWVTLVSWTMSNTPPPSSLGRNESIKITSTKSEIWTSYREKLKSNKKKLTKKITKILSPIDTTCTKTPLTTNWYFLGKNIWISKNQINMVILPKNK